jgi:hypothetical protein
MYFDPTSDLIQQLTRIADAVNRPGPPVWADWAKTLANFLCRHGDVSKVVASKREAIVIRYSERNAMRPELATEADLPAFTAEAKYRSSPW